MEFFYQGADGRIDPFILVVEGSIPNENNKADGYWASQKGGADKIFINTSGIGVVESPLNLSAVNAQPGDKVVLSGTLGDHGTTIMIARGEFGIGD
jgi:hypothetical protein